MCIFALLRDAFDYHVTVHITTRAVLTLESRIDDRFFSPLTFSQVPQVSFNENIYVPYTKEY